MDTPGSTWKQVGKLVLSTGLCLGVGLASGLATQSSMATWYAALEKPAFTPPDWLFGPVWTVLYVMMGIAAYLVWRHGWRRPEVKAALIIFAVQLLLNGAWSVVFFGLHSIDGALAVILALWVALALTISRFFPLSKAAGWLLIPYIAWVSFATMLNVALSRLN